MAIYKLMFELALNSTTPVVLLISPSAHLKQSKQQTGFPFCRTLRVPGGHFSLQTDKGTCMNKKTMTLILQ